MELPRLKSLFEKYKDRGLELVAIDRSRDTQAARQFIADNGLDYRFLENGTGKTEVVRSLFSVVTYPTTYVIDESGRIVLAHVGYEVGDEVAFDKEIASLLGS